MMKIKIIKGDITSIPVDIIVNSANKSLMKGSGVCGAIHTKAGIELVKECMEIKKKQNISFLPIGEIIVTKAYNLPAKYVIHTVGAKNNGREDISLIKNCYRNSLEKAEELKVRSISFPAISTGVYNLPIEISAKMVKEVLDELPNFKYIQDVYFVMGSEEHVKVYERGLN
jgi:O-acetyl-ADP-ribose deacetylase